MARARFDLAAELQPASYQGLTGGSAIDASSVVGNSGSGKSTLAKAIAARLGVPHVEMDALFHQPGWRELPAEEFRSVVAAAAAEPAWVIDGNYNAVREVIWERADTVVWLDLPRRVVMRQVTGRTLRRVVLRTELWNGNREPWSNMLSLDPQRSIVAWAWTNHVKYHDRYLAATADVRWAHLRFVAYAAGTKSRRGSTRLSPEPLGSSQPASGAGLEHGDQWPGGGSDAALGPGGRGWRRGPGLCVGPRR